MLRQTSKSGVIRTAGFYVHKNLNLIFKEILKKQDKLASGDSNPELPLASKQSRLGTRGSRTTLNVSRYFLLNAGAAKPI